MLNIIFLFFTSFNIFGGCCGNNNDNNNSKSNGGKGSDNCKYEIYFDKEFLKDEYKDIKVKNKLRRLLSSS